MNESARTAEGNDSQATGGYGNVVGIDGSPGSNHALAWAAERVDRFGPIRPVASWSYPTWAMANPMLGTPPPVSVESFAEVAKSQAEEVIAAIPESDRADLTLVQVPAGPALVEAGGDANLITVGTRGRGALADTFLGSVSSHVVAHATVPVAVVPESAPLGRPHGRVLVGIDGSPCSVDALHWALDHCRQTKDLDVVEAVHVWSHHVTAIPEPYMVPSEYTEIEAKQTLDNVVAQAIERSAGELPDLVRTLEYGDPRGVLRRLGEEADLLVLGARGHRGVAHLLLGSVTTGLVHQPLITTIVIPSTHG